MTKTLKKNRKRSSLPKPADRPSKKTKVDLIPIAAIGASAGGLDPIEQFFDVMLVNSGCAFVIIQHLSPDFRSLMDELLARHSTMEIHRISDGMEIKPNSIYLNSPRSIMTIEGNTLRVKQIAVPDTVYFPIDLFFESLAKERKEEAIGIVLSGTGSDGTKGSLAIEGAGGKVFVQDPETTRFDGMPKSLLADGFCTLVAAPEVLAECVRKALKNEPLDGLNSNDRLPIVDPLSDVLSMLKHRHGTDFLQYKEATIHRRIERRAHMRGLTDISEYRDILSVDTDELLELYADLLIEVTSFFRDHQAFKILQKKVIPSITKNLKDGSAIRVWVPGCASGEEAYSIAILLLEQARSMGIYVHLKIMATDIHVRSMNQASSGIYDEAALSNMPEGLIDQYFDRADGQAQIKPAVRNMVFFSSHDVTCDPPFTRIDLISCRNLLIYLKEEAQEKVMNLLHFSLRKDGYLFLGPSEHIGAIAHEFDVVNEKWRIYKKRRDVKLQVGESIFQRSDIGTSSSRIGQSQRLGSRSSSTDEESIPFRRAQRAALEAIVARYAPPGFLLSDEGVVVHIFGNAGELIPLQSGSFSKRIIDLIRPELKLVVTAALDQSKFKDFVSFKRVAYIGDKESSPKGYEISLIPMVLSGEAQKFLLLSIEETSVVVSSSPEEQASIQHMQVHENTEALQARIAVLEHNLHSSEENLQSTIEELETSNEELQSTNEELMSTNEELQSTNEELHSVNEELYTVSAEHQRKNEELTDRETDIGVLLQSSKIGTVHLDESLCVLRYTNHARNIFNILPQDIGRPIGHITVRTKEHAIFDLIELAHSFGETHETQLQIDKNVYFLRVLPYVKEERPINHTPALSKNSVLITVIDISDVESVRSQLAVLDSQLRDVVEHTDSFVVNWKYESKKITYCNDVFASRLNSTPEKMVGENILEKMEGMNTEEFKKIFSELKPNETQSAIFTRTDQDGQEYFASVAIRAITIDNVVIDEIQCIGYNCTDEHRYQLVMDELFSVFSDESIVYEDKLNRLLNVGLDYIGLESAFVSMLIGKTYEIKYVQHMRSSYNRKDVIGLNYDVTNSLCGQIIQEQAAIGVIDISNSDYRKLHCHGEKHTSCVIGAPVNTANGLYGTVSFISKSVRHSKFTTQEKNFILLMGNWIGSLIGNQEQIDFISNQNEYYKSLFQRVPTMLFLSDSTGLVISASDRLCNKLGVNPDSVPGKNCFELFKTSNDVVLQNAVMQGDARDLPLTITSLDGSSFEVELNSSIKAVGVLKGMRMVVLTDVSERNKAIQVIENRNKSLASANENLNKFAFIASHDLQEPLRKIQQFSSLLNDELKEKMSEDGVYHLDVIVDASERMSALIYDLLRFSGASQEEPKIQAVDLNELLVEVTKELDMSIAESNAKIVIGDLGSAKGDRALLRQLFTNMVSNSIKYRSKDRPLEVSVIRFGQDNIGGIKISDNGIGFEMEFAQKIFEPFNRLHKHKDYKGNGIGLAICSTVCEKHGWRLDADSALGVGSTFTIRFD